jgi:hypothetical protein
MLVHKAPALITASIAATIALGLSLNAFANNSAEPSPQDEQCEFLRQKNIVLYRLAHLDALEQESLKDDSSVTQRLAEARAYMRSMNWTSSACGLDRDVAKLEAVRSFFAAVDSYGANAGSIERLPVDALSDDPAMANLTALATAISTPAISGQDSLRQLIRAVLARKAEIQAGAPAKAYELEVLANEKAARYVLALHALAHGIPYKADESAPAAPTAPSAQPISLHWGSVGLQQR